MFIGRKEELRILEDLYSSEKFEFGYIYGQRRIGKTFLVDEFCKNKKSLILFASDSDDITIRRDFARTLSLKIMHKGITFDDWDSFFLAVSSYFGDEKGVFVIDEYPNILLTRDGKRKRTDFVSKLQNAIDRIFKKQKILIILTGSNVSFMEKEVNDTRAPLYQRNTFQSMLSKLEWNDAISLLNGMSDIDKIKTLCITDTFPFYLSNIDTSKSFAENLNKLFFNRDSLFVNDPSKLFSSEIESSGLYSGIMRNLSSGVNTITALANVLNTETSVISIYLEKLIKNKVVTKCSMFNSKRVTYYKINDRMTSFYFRFILQNSENIKLGYGKMIKEEYTDAIEDFIHKAFEDVCITYLSNKSKNMELGGLFIDFQNYVVEKSPLGRSVEIDILSEYKDKLLVGECKMSNHKKGYDVLEKMKENVSIYPFVEYKKIIFYIFSTAGFKDSLIENKDENVHLIDLNQLLN